MKEEVIFSNLSMLANEKDRVTAEYEKDKWISKAYTTGKYSGQMLITTEHGLPEQLTFDLNLKGRYKIFVSLPKMRSGNFLFIRLSDDRCFTGMSATDDSPKNWSSEEYLEEVYWKTADLTGQKLVIRKPDANYRSITGIAWIRCVPETAAPDIPRNKCMQMHMDEDVAYEILFETGEEYLMKLYQCKDTNADFVSFEVSFDYDSVPQPKDRHLRKTDDRWDRGMYDYIRNKELIYKKNIDFARENHIGLYAANRMQVSNFVAPFSIKGWNMRFVEENPQYYCKTRLGTTVRECSYAYEQVQDYVIGNLVDAVKYGFDGVSLIYHRGMHIGFDQPVLDRFRQLYPDVDPFRLPFSDPRLHNVWCEFMNTFMRKLRNALGEGIKINTITNYGLESSKNIGLDVAYWAANGLIDSASQADMETCEELYDCMSEEEPGLIDLDKYCKAIEERTVVTRYYLTNVDKICDHMHEYTSLKTLYGIDVYHVLPWVGSVKPEDYDGIVQRMREAGAEKFLSWNTNHLLWNRPEWHTVSHIGNAPIGETLRKFYRVLSFDGNDISHYLPNWRG